MTVIDMATAGRQEVTLGTPVCGIMTAISTASAAVKAGSSALAGRRYLRIRNTDTSVAVRIGPSSMTDYSGGMSLEPLAAVEWNFDPLTAVDVYARSTGAAVELEVTESI